MFKGYKYIEEYEDTTRNPDFQSIVKVILVKFQVNFHFILPFWLRMVHIWITVGIRNSEKVMGRVAIPTRPSGKLAGKLVLKISKA